MSQFTHHSQQTSRAEGSISRMRQPGQIQKSHSSDFPLPNTVSEFSRPHPSELKTSQSVSECPSSESELRARKRKSFIRDVNGHCAFNSIELSDVSAISALDQRPTFKRTRGHCFISASLRSPTWCDRCGDFIWGVYKQCLICTNLSTAASNMFSAIWNAAAMLTGSRDSWNSTSSTESATVEHNFSRSSSARDWQDGDYPEYHGDAGFSEDPDSRLLPWTTGSGTGNNKLFLQLLDDLDGITSNTDSAHRRRKARELMSDYIFRPDMHIHGDHFSRGHALRRSSAAEYGLHPPEVAAIRSEWASRRSSGDFSGVQVPSPKVSPEHRAARCRSGDFSGVELIDTLVSPKSSPQHLGRPQRGHLDRLQWQSHPPYCSTKEVDNVEPSEECFLQRSPSKRRWFFNCHEAKSFIIDNDVITENEDDSGYHTGNSQLLKRSPGARTLSREDCKRRISMFNVNNHGLVMNPPEGDSETFHGSIRVHMNLVRPINMCISLPPATIYDVHQGNDSSSVQMTSFYLPKETSKVIHITSAMTTPEVIQVLLSKFHITDNPRKFALYEKVLETGKPVTMRRVRDDELPLQICLSWTDDSIDKLDCKQFVLQDYDTGEILWEAFSLPELESFLTVLNREEFEYMEQVKTKYRLLKVQLMKKLKDFELKSDAVCGAKRKPVFV